MMTSSRKCIIMAMLMVVATSSLVAGDGVKSMTFYDFFQGEWHVQKSTISMQTNEQELDHLLGHYSVQKDNLTESLIGHAYDNDTETGDLSNFLDFAVEFSTHNSGSFKIRSAADGGGDDEGTVLFNFDFREQGNGMLIAHGEWNGEEGGFYQFTLAPFDKFTITLLPRAPAAGATAPAAAAITLYTGIRIPEHVEKTFFQKYGMMMMMGGFFIFNMFVQSKTKQHLNSGRATVGAGAGGAGAAAAAAPIVESSGPKKNQ